MKILKRTKNNTRSGFTLIELMVSLGIFAIVAVVAAAALLKIIDANKKAQSIQNAMTNMNFALESMSRELRTGTAYNCSSGSSEGTEDVFPFTTSQACDLTFQSQGDNSSTIAFRSSDPATGTDSKFCPDNLAYAYRFISNGNGTFTLKKAKQIDGNCNNSIRGEDFADVISTNNVTITGYRVLVIYNNDSGSTGHKYPLAVIRITGYAGTTERNRSYFDVETAASSRLP